MICENVVPKKVWIGCFPFSILDIPDSPPAAKTHWLPFREHVDTRLLDLLIYVWNCVDVFPNPMKALVPPCCIARARMLPSKGARSRLVLRAPGSLFLEVHVWFYLLRSPKSVGEMVSTFEGLELGDGEPLNELRTGNPILLFPASRPSASIVFAEPQCPPGCRYRPG